VRTARDEVLLVGEGDEPDRDWLGEPAPLELGTMTDRGLAAGRVAPGRALTLPTLVDAEGAILAPGVSSEEAAAPAALALSARACPRVTRDPSAVAWNCGR